MYRDEGTTGRGCYYRVLEVYSLVEKKLAKFPGSCLSFPWYSYSTFVYAKTMVGVKKILPEIWKGGYKNMAVGLPEAHNLISLSSGQNPNGRILLLFSNGLADNNGDFFDNAEGFISTVPVHTFTVGSDAYNQVPYLSEG